MPEIQNVSVRHESIMNFMLANPTVPLSLVAVRFGVTQPWLSTVIHSNAFQARLREKQDEFFGAVVVPLQEKVIALAHTGVEKLHECIAKSMDDDFIAEKTISILDRLGYSPASRGIGPANAVAGNMNVQNNVYVSVDRETLANARAAIGRRAPELLEQTGVGVFEHTAVEADEAL